VTDQEMIEEFESFLRGVGKPPRPGTAWSPEDKARLAAWMAARPGRREWLGLSAAEPGEET
jgi:hypothetical protein